MVKKILSIVSVAVALIVGHNQVLAKPKVVPLPRLKPDILTEKVAPPPASPRAIAFPASFASGWSRGTVLAQRQACAKRLWKLNLVYEALAPIGREGGCGAPAPLLVSSIAGVEIVPPAEMTCDMAEALHGWVSSSLVPTARNVLKKRVVTINNASAYACRRRNSQASGKLSEHGKANALDISTLAFEDGSSVNIKGDWTGLKQLVGVSAQGNFLRLIRRDACIRFTTVLGPGSDPYHGDHFHIDVLRRKNGYRICK